MENNSVKNLEKEIIDKEKKITKEIKSEEAEIKKLNRRIMMISAFLILVVGGAIGAFAYMKVADSRVYIENSQISAPQIQLAPQISGILQNVYVQEGDTIGPDTAVALVGNQLIKSQVGGLIISVNKNIGTLFNPGQAVVTMIQPQELRVVGQLEEDKGLDEIHVGDRAIFTIDAFGSKQYQGVVDEISPTSKNSDVVFNISNQRQENDFDVKIRFDAGQYPELKNGMSAKIWVYKN